MREIKAKRMQNALGERIQDRVKISTNTNSNTSKVMNVFRIHTFSFFSTLSGIGVDIRRNN